MVVGLIQGQSVQLSEIANHIPGETQAAGRIARIRRWLASKWIVSRTLSTSVIDENQNGIPEAFGLASPDGYLLFLKPIIYSSWTFLPVMRR